ncbi:hypothetical protein ABPG72_018991 [Tetrahymena utriculariae]
MDKQNFLSQGQQGILSTQNVQTQNLLCKKKLDSNQIQNLESYPNIINELDKNIFDIQNKESSLSVKDSQTNEIDLEKKTKEIKNHEISNKIKKDSENKIKEIQNQSNLSNMKKAGEEHNNIPLNFDLTLKKKVQSQFLKNFEKNKLFQKVALQVFNNKEEQNLIVSYENQDQKSCLQCLSTISNLNDISRQFKILNINSKTQTIRKGKKHIPDPVIQEGQLSSYENNQAISKTKNEYYDSTKNQPKKENKEQIFDNSANEQSFKQDNQLLKKYQEAQQKTNESKIQIKNSIQQQRKLTENYASQVQELLDRIDEHSFQDLNIQQKELDQQKSEFNPYGLYSKAFENQKAKIFKKLNEDQFYLCKILASDNKQTLILGFQEKQSVSEFTGQNQNIQLIQLIIHNPAESEIVCLIQLFQTLQLKFHHFQIEQEKIQIFRFKKNEFLLIQEKFEVLTQFQTYIQQIKEYYEINSSSFLSCEKCSNQNICENYQCFKNVKTRILDFFKNKKYFYCEYQDKLIEGLIFQFNQEELSTFYINYAYELIFSFLKSEEINQKSQLKETDNQKINDYQQNSQTLNLQLVSEYLFKEYLVQKKLDSNEEKSHLYNTYIREWDIIKFIAANKNEVSETFKKEQNDIISILQNKKYYLCKSLISRHNEDAFIGYQEESQEQL